MKRTVYVISIKRVKAYIGDEDLKNPEWEYPYFFSGWLIFGSRTGTKEFMSVEEAENWWNENARFLSEHFENYDLSSLAIRKETVVTTYSAEKKLHV